MFRCWGICIDDVKVEGDSLHSLRSVVTSDTEPLLSVSRLSPCDVSALLSPRCHNIPVGVRIKTRGHSPSVSVSRGSQSIDLSRGILKTSEFGELINTGAFSSSRIPEKMKTDRHFAAGVQKLNLLQTLKLSCHSYFNGNYYFANSKIVETFVVFLMQKIHFSGPAIL